MTSDCSRFVLIVTTLCATMAAAVSAQETSKGAALLTEARNAIGGEEKLRAVKRLDVRGDFRRAAGQTRLEGELQIRLELPDKLRRDEDLSLPGGGPAIVGAEVLNGTAVWDDASGGGTLIGRFGRGGRGAPDGGGGRAAADPGRLEEQQRKARQMDLARFMLAWLLATDAPASWIGTAEAPDGRADVLEIVPSSGPATRLFLDQASHMPLMMTWQGAAPQLRLFGRRGGGGRRGDGAQRLLPPQGPQQATLRMTLGDYKAVDGLKLPHLITRDVNDLTIEEWTVRSYRINPSFRSDVFTK